MNNICDVLTIDCSFSVKRNKFSCKYLLLRFFKANDLFNIFCTTKGKMVLSDITLNSSQTRRGKGGGEVVRSGGDRGLLTTCMIVDP